MNQPGGTASIGMNLQFSNGQYVKIAAMGNFTIYRPTAQILDWRPLKLTNAIMLTC
jgi:hypothetical protein